MKYIMIIIRIYFIVVIITGKIYKNFYLHSKLGCRYF